MPKTAYKIRFIAKLFRPKATAKAISWTFLILPKDASARLPSRGTTSVEGMLNGFPFRATLEPDGEGGHWLKVDRKMRETARAEAGDLVALEIAPVAVEPEPEVFIAAASQQSNCQSGQDSSLSYANGSTKAQNHWFPKKALGFEAVSPPSPSPIYSKPSPRASSNECPNHPAKLRRNWGVGFT